MSLESVVVPSALNSQAARDFLTLSLAGPQTIAPLPRVCAQLAQLTAQQATDASQLAKLIQSDAALAGEIMRVANSPALRPRSPIVSLQQAVSWLGVAEVRNIALKNKRARGDLSVQQARDIVMRAVATQQLAQQIAAYNNVVDVYGRGAGVAFFDQVVVAFAQHLVQLQQPAEALKAIERARRALRVEPSSQLESDFAQLTRAVKAAK